MELGVRYALARDGSVADPATATRLEHSYRCLDCGEHVHVCRGEVRKAHFAHYAERPHPCNAETIAHEAAKRKLVALLLTGTHSIGLRLPCRGYTDTFGDNQDCPDEAQLEQLLQVPDFDHAGVEVLFQTYRLDAAASLKGRVVLGLEVYQSHFVDAPKRAALSAAGLPWAELHANEVLERPMPWGAVTSSFGPQQCSGCAEREVEALAERRRWAAAEAARREVNEKAAQRETERAAQAARIVPVARKGNNLIFGRRDRIGMVFTCLACKEPVTATRTDSETVAFVHRPGKACDARRAWVRAGMWEVYKQLERAPGAVRILQRCSGEGCERISKEPPPEFDRVKCKEPSLTLFRAGEPVMQLVFGRDAQLLDSVEALELRPGKACHKPTVWWRRRNGKLCDGCTARGVKAVAEERERCDAALQEHEAREQERDELSRRRQEQGLEAARERAAARSAQHLELLRRKVAKLGRDPERVQTAVEFAKSYLQSHNVSLEQARTFGVVVRRCEHCGRSVAYPYFPNLQKTPPRLGHIDPTQAGAVLHFRCGSCQEPLSGEVTGPAVYLLPEDLS